MRDTLLAKDYDYLSPLMSGDVASEGVDLAFARSTGTAYSARRLFCSVSVYMPRIEHIAKPVS